MDLTSLLKDVIAYAEVRSNNDNRSAAVYKELEFLGAQIRTSFSSDVTHVVFKEGTRRTWNKAKKLNVPLVAVSWLESVGHCVLCHMPFCFCEPLVNSLEYLGFPSLIAIFIHCRLNYTQMPVKDFPAIMPEEILSPFPKFNQRPRWKKMKSMQPCDFDEELARSAERGERKRKREFLATRFKITDDLTPIASSPRSILALDTQARSPSALSTLSSYYSPVPETPSSLKERLEKMLRDQREVLEMDVEPSVCTPSLQHVEKPQQRRLFDCNLTSSSSEETVATSRLVQGVINSLESDSENPVSCELARRKLTVNADSAASSCAYVNNFNVSPKSVNSTTPSRIKSVPLKSPHRNFARPSHANNNENSIQASEAMADHRSKQSLKPLSPQDLNVGVVPPFASATLTDGDAVSLKDYKLNPPASSLSALLGDGGSGDHNLAFKEFARVSKVFEGEKRSSSNFQSRRQSKLSCVIQNEDHDVRAKTPNETETTDPVSKNSPLQPKLTRKRHLFSRCQVNALLDEAPAHSQKEQISKRPFLSTNQMDDSMSSAKADASFLFSIGGPKSDTNSGKTLKSKQVSHTRKGSKKKNYSSDRDLNLSNKSSSQDKSCSQLVPSSCTQDESATKTQLESSMSVMYPSEASQIKPSQRRSARLSINEFSFKNTNIKKTDKSKSKQNKCETNEENIAESLKSTNCASTTSVEARKNTRAKRKRSRSSSGAKVSEEENCKKRKKTKSSSSQEKVDLNTSSAADNEKGTSAKLRHARSLILASPDLLFKKDKYSLVMTSLHRDEQDVVCSVVKKFGIFCMTKNVEPSTTHVVCGDARRTLNILKAITRGCWVLSKEWVLESLEEDNWLLEEKYEMEKEFPAAKKSRLQREKAGQCYKPDLFSKTGPIFVYNECTPPRDELVHLINLCCGSVTGSQTRASIFVGDNHDPKRLVIQPIWILDSIMKLEALNPSEYIVPAPMSASQREASPEF